MSQDIRIAIFAGVIPGLIAGVSLLAFWWNARRLTRRATADGATDASALASTRGGPWISPFWVAPLALGLGWISAPLGVDPVLSLWPDDNTARLSHAVLLAALLGVVEGLVRLPTLVAALLRAAAYAGLWWMLTEGYHPHTLDTPTLIGWILVAAVGGAALATIAEVGLTRTRAWVAGPLIALWGGALIYLLLTAGYAIGAQAVPALVAFGVAVAVVGLLVRRTTLARGTATALVGVLLAMLAGAGIQSEPRSTAGLVLLALAPVAFGALALASRPDGKPASCRAMLAGGLTLIVLLASAGVTLELTLRKIEADRNEQSEPDPYADYYSE